MTITSNSSNCSSLEATRAIQGSDYPIKRTHNAPTSTLKDTQRTHEYFEDLAGRVLLDLPQPGRQTVKGGLGGHVIHQDEGVGRAVVGLSDGPEPLLACCVPYLELLRSSIEKEAR